MEITYKYQDYELKTVTLGELEKVIVEVRYNYIGECEDGIKSSYPGRTILPQPDSENFKSFEELSEEEIITWLDSLADITNMRSLIQQHIEQQSGVIYKGDDLPWVDKPNIE
jgi:hypothetical protein